MSPLEITEKIIELIKQKDKVSLSDLEARAYKRAVPMTVFDQAINTLHKLKTIKRTVRGNDIWYSIVTIKEKTVKERACLIRVKGLTILPLGEFQKEEDRLYCKGRVLTAGSNLEFIWFTPTDIGLPSDNLPLPEQARPDLIPFEAIPEQEEVYNPYIPSWQKFKRKNGTRN